MAALGAAFFLTPASLPSPAFAASTAAAQDCVDPDQQQVRLEARHPGRNIRLVKQISGPVAASFLEAFNRWPPATAFQADLVAVFGMATSRQFLVVGFREGCLGFEVLVDAQAVALLIAWAEQRAVPKPSQGSAS